MTDKQLAAIIRTVGEVVFWYYISKDGDADYWNNNNDFDGIIDDLIATEEPKKTYEQKLNEVLTNDYKPLGS